MPMLSATIKVEGKRLQGFMRQEAVLSGMVHAGGRILATLQAPTTIGESLYTGDYEIAAGVEEKRIPVGDKTMAKDLVIMPVPTFEVSNDAGGSTFIIGG